MRLGRWELGEELGRGGMGVVYRAHDGAGRAAALKVVTSTGDAELLVRFQREVSPEAHLAEALALRAAGRAEGAQAALARAMALAGDAREELLRSTWELGPR